MNDELAAANDRIAELERERDEAQDQVAELRAAVADACQRFSGHDHATARLCSQLMAALAATEPNP